MFPPGFALWWTLVCLTALLPGSVVGYLAKKRHWPRNRCRMAALGGALFCFFTCLSVAILGFHLFPFGGAGPASILPVWVIAVLSTPAFAERVAKTRTGF